jgi:aromatic-L-amino-acid decarboxylase
MPDPMTPLDPEALRTLGHQMVDFLADYWSRLESFPALCQAQPGEVRAKLPAHAPVAPDVGDYAPVLADLERIILPGLTHWQHPGFGAFFPANISTPAVLGELLAAGLGVQGMLWQTSPACTELETHVLDWMADLLGLPEAFKSTSPRGGCVIQGTASEATLVALVAARNRVRTAASPPSSPRPQSLHLTLYASTQAHSSLVKAAMIAGLADSPEDRTHVRLIGTTPDLAMDPVALEAAIRTDLAAGRTPCMVHATVGTTSSTAFDPLDQIAAVMERTGISGRGAWLHADAAYAGAAMICPEFRPLQRGVERVDSYCFNPHKWLLTNFDCDCFYTRDRQALIGALSITPEYLRNQLSESGQVIDYRDWQIPLGRRFRALKLWLVIRHFGVKGLQAYIREHIRLTGVFLELIGADPAFEICAPHPLNLVCFRLLAPGRDAAVHDALNRDLLARLNASGRLYLTHTVLPDPSGAGSRAVLRYCIGTATTREEHVRGAWDLIRQTARAVLG